MSANDPAPSIEIAYGRSNAAAEPWPSTNPTTPFLPATVVTRPVVKLTRRIRLTMIVSVSVCMWMDHNDACSQGQDNQWGASCRPRDQRGSPHNQCERRSSVKCHTRWPCEGSPCPITIYNSKRDVPSNCRHDE